MKKFSLLILVAILAAGGTVAGIYKWVDKEGVTHYDEHPPSDTEAEQFELAPGPSDEAVRQAQERLKSLLRSQLGRDERLAEAARIPSQRQIIGYWNSVNVGRLDQGDGEVFFRYQWYSFYEDGTTSVAMSNQPRVWGSEYLDANRKRGEYGDYRLENGLLQIQEGPMRFFYRLHIFSEDIDEFQRGDLLMFGLNAERGQAVSFHHLRRLDG